MLAFSSSLQIITVAPSRLMDASLSLVMRTFLAVRSRICFPFFLETHLKKWKAMPEKTDDIKPHMMASFGEYSLWSTGQQCRHSTRRTPVVFLPELLRRSQTSLPNARATCTFELNCRTAQRRESGLRSSAFLSVEKRETSGEAAKTSRPERRATRAKGKAARSTFRYLGHTRGRGRLRA